MQSIVNKELRESSTSFNIKGVKFFHIFEIQCIFEGRKEVQKKMCKFILCD